jgi:hypothetical protein
VATLQCHAAVHGSVACCCTEVARCTPEWPPDLSAKAYRLLVLPLAQALQAPHLVCGAALLLALLSSGRMERGDGGQERN